jgi:hypothetical protein
MSDGRRVRTHLVNVLVGAALVAALPVLAPPHVSAAPAQATPASTGHTSAQRAMPFQTLSPQERAGTSKRRFRSAGSEGLDLIGSSDASGSGQVDLPTSIATIPPARQTVAAPLTPSTGPDVLRGFSGISQASTIHEFGADQKVTPPNEDIAIGPNYLVEVVNSTVEVFNRAGTAIESNDLNRFMDVPSGYRSSDPRVIFDVTTGRFWITVTEVPNSGCPTGAHVLIAVSASSNPLPLLGWHVFALPKVSGTLFGDQPGLGEDGAALVVTFNDFNCSLQFTGSEVDILQKTDLENRFGAHPDDVFFDGPFAPQAVQTYDNLNINWVVTNEADCGVVTCTNPVVEVDEFQGTPEGGGAYMTSAFVPITGTSVNNATGLVPSTNQPSPGPNLQTNDDRFLNAVEENEELWTADGTSCFPPGDSVKRPCLDYVEINVTPYGTPPVLTTQINNVGVDGAGLFYPEVAVDSGGNMMTVFDESSTTMNPSIMDAAVPANGTTLTAFQTLHTSATYYNGDNLFGGACDSNGCRWGDYSGATQDQAENGHDVWVVSESADGTVEGACATAHACWNTRIDQLTMSGPTPTALTPDSGPQAGGTTVVVTGRDFAADTTLQWNGSPIPFANLTPTSVTFVTPAAVEPQELGFLTVTDSLGFGQAENFNWVDPANYFPLSPFRILDTRTSGGVGVLGPGAIRSVQVSGIGATPVPENATAVVLNVTEVSGSVASLLTLFPDMLTRPNVSNLNFPAHTVIANLVTVGLTLGKVSIYNALGTVNAIVDVEGYFLPEPNTDLQGLFHPMTPARVCDTRPASPTPTCSVHGALGAGGVMVVDVSSAGGIPADGTAEAAVVNITGVAGSSGTYLSLFPTNSSGGCAFSGRTAPPFSTINLTAGAVAANRVMVDLGPATSGGPDDALCVYNSAGTINVLIDANGWFGSSTASASPAGYQFQALDPTRICDTRVASASCTKAAIGAAVNRLIGVAGDGGIPSTTNPVQVVAIMANLTAVAPTQTTFLTLYSANLTHQPTVSDLNVTAGQVRPNLAVVELDTTGDAHDGDISLYNSAGSVNAIIDIEGWFQ